MFAALVVPRLLREDFVMVGRIPTVAYPANFGTFTL